MRDYESYKEYEKLYGVKWRQLAAAEPALNKLLEQARDAGNGCRTLDQINRRFTPFTSPIQRLVGFFGKHKGHPILGTQAAYDIVYWRVRNAVAGDHVGE
jgi:hypothetical protein